MSVTSALFVPFFTKIFLQKYNFGILHFPNSAILNAYKEVGARIAEGKIDMVIFFNREYTCISEDYTDMNQRRVQDIQEEIDSSGK